MLVLSRKKYERICIGEAIVVTICHIGPNAVKIGIDAPKDVTILREEHRGTDDRSERHD